MEAIKELYKKDLILESDAKTKEEVLQEVGDYLYGEGLVKESFSEAIIEREGDYPTGIDLAPIAEGLPNVAIPHTDTEHCDSKAIVFVKLKKAVTFNNMIKPEEELPVSYLFMIVNDQKTNQTNVLSELMGFMTNEDNMHELDALDSKEEIYEFLVNNKRSEE